MEVEVEDADRPDAALAEGPDGGRGVVEVAVAGLEGGAGVVSRRPADGVGEARPGDDPLGGGDRGADALAGGGDEAGVDGNVGLQPGRGEVHHHHRLAGADAAERIEVARLVQ
jgi:hypothetical protein